MAISTNPNRSQGKSNRKSYAIGTRFSSIFRMIRKTKIIELLKIITALLGKKIEIDVQAFLPTDKIKRPAIRGDGLLAFGGAL